LIGARTGAVLVLAGPGNNGGDAFVVARWLRAWFYEVSVVFCGDASELPADAAAAYRALLDSGAATVAEVPANWRGALIVDGLFGIGLARPLSGEYAAWVEWMNGAGVPILALDIPSGLDAETGIARVPCVRASATATFIAMKPGLLTLDGPDHCGSVSVHDLGLAERLPVGASGRLLAWNVVARSLPPVLHRACRSAHKGSFGTLGIVGGAPGMVGAAWLAGRAALHAGAGKVLVGSIATDAPAIDQMAPELMLRAADAVLLAELTALVCGPGLGYRDDLATLVARAIELPVPLLLDADALNLVARIPALAADIRSRAATTTLTPHPAEAARLLGVTTAGVQSDRLAATHALAERFRASVVLKGHGSVLAHPDGAWEINGSGNVGLASGGTGDVLAGFVGALLAQGIDAADALRIGVCLHGAAADALVAQGDGPLGLTAGELTLAARRLLNRAAHA
jgi:hydroxyethylthiazole kinase-like uncharacterized protein yjeF